MNCFNVALAESKEVRQLEVFIICSDDPWTAVNFKFIKHRVTCPVALRRRLANKQKKRYSNIFFNRNPRYCIYSKNL